MDYERLILDTSRTDLIHRAMLVKLPILIIGKVNILYSQERHLQYGNPSTLRLLSSRIGESERGRVLDFFSRIEFALDIMVYMSQGVYEHDELQDAVYELCLKNGTLSLQKRVDNARSNKFITELTRNKINNAAKIRNVLAHSFMPDDAIALKLAKDAKGEDAGKKIANLMNDTWASLSSDYANNQERVGMYLIAKLGLKKRDYINSQDVI